MKRRDWTLTNRRTTRRKITVDNDRARLREEKGRWNFPRFLTLRFSLPMICKLPWPIYNPPLWSMAAERDSSLLHGEKSPASSNRLELLIGAVQQLNPLLWVSVSANICCLHNALQPLSLWITRMFQYVVIYFLETITVCLCIRVLHTHTHTHTWIFVQNRVFEDVKKIGYFP